MRRLVRVRWVAPVAMLGAGCAARPFTPSLSVIHFAEAVPEGQGTALPSTGEALARWMPAGTVWEPWAKPTLLAALGDNPAPAELPDVSRLDVVKRARAAAARVAAAGLPPHTLIVVDLRGAGSVAFGVALSQSATTPVACVPTFNNWPAEYELVPAEETLAAMVTMTPRLPGPFEGAAPVFLLDAWRLADREMEPDDEAVDNRYMLNPADLPDAATLRTHNIQRVLYVVESLDDAEMEEDDLNAPMLAWQGEGLAITMVDLAWLERFDRDWDRAFDGHRLVVKARRTVFDDRAFYERARGGFGGVHAGPSPFRTGIHFGSRFGGHFTMGGWGGGRGGGG